MKIKKLTIHNWRSIKDIEVLLKDIMILIGQNNHGKSNILTSILYFFGELKVNDLDFNENSDELYVELTFDTLDDYDRSTFSKYIMSDDTLCVRKTTKRDGTTNYNGYIERAREEWLQDERVSDYTTREIIESTPLAYYIPRAGRLTKGHVQEAQKKYIEEHRESLDFEYTLEASSFLGTKNVAKGIFGEVFYIPAVKDVNDELNMKSNSVFNQLYSRVITAMSEMNKDYKDAKEKIVTLAKSLNKINEFGCTNTERPEQLNSLEEMLDEELTDWNAKIDVEIMPPNIDDIFKLGTCVWVNDGCRTDINRKGHGLQRALIFALIRTLAKSTIDEEIAATVEREVASGRQKSRSMFFIIEEPELYLHPQAQRQTFNSLIKLSKSVGQVLLCTHSSAFISLEDYDSICVVRKENNSIGTIPLQCLENLFESTEEKEHFNLVYWINPDRSELFFAKKVILVEGPTDKTIIPLLANIIGCFRYDYTLIDCASKDSIQIYIKLLNKFSIPYVAVYDRDHQVYKNSDAIANADKSTLKIEEAIDSRIGRSVVFENDIEEELCITEKEDRNKPYIALKYVCSDEFKLAEGPKQKIISIYS